MDAVVGNVNVHGPSGYKQKSMSRMKTARESEKARLRARQIIRIQQMCDFKASVNNNNIGIL